MGLLGNRMEKNKSFKMEASSWYVRYVLSYIIVYVIILIISVHVQSKNLLEQIFSFLVQN